MLPSSLRRRCLRREPVFALGVARGLLFHSLIFPKNRRFLLGRLGRLYPETVPLFDVDVGLFGGSGSP